MEHRPRNGMWENKCFVKVGKKFLTFTKHMPFRSLSSIPPLLRLSLVCLYDCILLSFGLFPLDDWDGSYLVCSFAHLFGSVKEVKLIYDLPSIKILFLLSHFIVDTILRILSLIIWVRMAHCAHWSAHYILIDWFDLNFSISL